MMSYAAAAALSTPASQSRALTLAAPVGGMSAVAHRGASMVPSAGSPLAAQRSAGAAGPGGCAASLGMAAFSAGPLPAAAVKVDPPPPPLDPRAALAALRAAGPGLVVARHKDAADAAAGRRTPSLGTSKGELYTWLGQFHKMPADGLCFYHAMSYILQHYGLIQATCDGVSLRQHLVTFIRSNGDLDMGGGTGSLRDWVGIASRLSITEYADLLATTKDWAGGIQIAVLARALTVNRHAPKSARNRE